MLSKITKNIFYVALLVAGMSTAAFAAPETVNKTDLALNASGVIYDDTDQFELFGRFTYGVTEYVRVGFETGYYFDSSVEDAGVDFGDLSGVPLLADVLVRYPNDSNFVPYGVLGLGAIFWNFDESSLVKNSGVTVNVDTSFAVKLGAGVDYFLNDHWALNLEAAYVISDASVTASAAGTVASADVDSDHWVLGGGVKYLF